jgi:cell division protein FtsB
MAHNAKAFSSRTWIAVAVVGVLLLLAFAFLREYVRNSDIATELARMQAENDALNAQRLASLQLISQLSTETVVEGEARTKLNLAREGETMYVVEDGGATDADGEDMNGGDVALVADDPGLSNPAKWFYYFFAPDDVFDGGAL